jgi:hypothetical protein
VPKIRKQYNINEQKKSRDKMKPRTQKDNKDLGSARNRDITDIIGGVVEAGDNPTVGGAFDETV